MQPITPVSLDDLMANPQEVLQKLEVYDGAAWQNLCALESSPLPGWPKRKLTNLPIPASGLTDFPICIKINADADIGAACRADGFDIRFTAANGVTLLKYERESFAVAGGPATGIFWVKVPSVLTTGTYIWCYYGNASASDGSTPNDVWDSNFKAVYHMKDGADNAHISDSTANANNGTKKGANEPIEADGKIGKGQDFDGANDYAFKSLSDSLNGDFAKYSVSWWVKATDQNTDYEIMWENGDATYTTAHAYLAITTRFLTVNGIRQGGTSQTINGPTLAPDTWTHVGFVYDSAAGKEYLYINGAYYNQANVSGNIAAEYGFWLGIRTTTAYPFDGMLDEVRISTNVARSAAWIAYEYANMNAADGGLTWGAEESLYKNFLKSLSFNLGGAGMSPDPIAGTWSATLDNQDGIFHPKHPTSAYKDLLRVGRKVRISIGGKYGGVPYYWQRLIGFMDAPKFQNGARTVALAGCDYMKALTDTILRAPNNYWGSSVTKSTTASTPTLGSELYTNGDAARIAAEINGVGGWTAAYSPGVSSVADAGGGSTYVIDLSTDAGIWENYAWLDGLGSFVAGKVYKVSFKYCIMSGGGDTEFQFGIYKTGTTELMGQVTGLKSWAWVVGSFYFTATASGAIRVRVELADPAYSAQSVRFDLISIKEVTGWTNDRYTLPADCNGPYYATLDGIPHWYGETDPPQGWFYDPATKLFYFADGYIVGAGTNNLIVYYYTTQTMENVVADLLVTAGLYATQAAALADMIYTATEITVPKVWFDAGVSALEAVRQLCERCNYRFWFNETGKPVFRPAPAAGASMASFTGRQLQDLSDFQDMNEIRNRIVIEGIEQAMYQPNEGIRPSRLKGEASDATSISTYLEKTYSATNRLFQTQAAIDAMCTTLLAAYKDPKWYGDLQVPLNPIPLERGDTITWDVILRPVLGDGAHYAVPQYGDGTHYGDEGLRAVLKGIIRDISYSGGGFKYKCELTA